MIRRATTRAVRCASLLALVVAACGDDGETDAGTSSTVAGDATASSGDGGGTGGGGALPGSSGVIASSSSTSGSDATGVGGAGGAGAGGAGGEAPIDVGPELYPAGRVHSPVTAHVAARLEEIVASSPSSPADVFMKVGGSSTVSRSTLFCFDGDAVDLAAHDELEETLAFYLGGDAAGTSPFARESLAAEVGRSASWAISGDPSPMASEIAAVDPRVALVHYGTNDMGGGATYESALVAFYGNLGALVEGLEAQGIVPILFGITRRGDSDAAQHWVSAFNATIRATAQRLQTPFVDLYFAIDPLEGHGLSGDGLHLEAYDEGACVLDDAGLEHGYNVRNLVALEALDRVRRMAFDDAPPFDDPGPRLEGDGDAGSPWRIDALPFAHTADTTAGARLVDAYPACGSDADESGPELVYRLELDAPRRIRAIVLDRDGVDVDLHLLASEGDECIARGHHTVEAALDAGSYSLVVDSWVGADGIERAGEYTLVVVECDDDDEACGA